jgi:D-3-phosphoglycerate dehydrogenase
MVDGMRYVRFLSTSKANLSAASSCEAFRVGVTRDFRRSDGSFAFAPAADLGSLEAAPGIEWEFVRADVAELTPGLLSDYDALFHFSTRVSAASLEGIDRLLLLARSGVGLDFIDVAACTERGIAVTITPEPVARAMASAAVAFVLALSHRLVERNTLFHKGRWQEGRFGLFGVGLTNRTLGIIGFGRIGREVVRLLEPWEMRTLVSTPRLSAEEATARRVEHVELDELLAESDYIVVACPLKPDTHHLLDADRLALMKSTAFLVNVARGPIVDQAALTASLREGRLAGVGLDVFEQEPIDPADPLLGMENVVAAPHALGYWDELFRGCVQSASRAILDVASGRVPEHLANPAVLDNPEFREKLHRLRARSK